MTFSHLCINSLKVTFFPREISDSLGTSSCTAPRPLLHIALGLVYLWLDTYETFKVSSSPTGFKLHENRACVNFAHLVFPELITVHDPLLMFKKYLQNEWMNTCIRLSPEINQLPLFFVPCPPTHLLTTTECPQSIFEGKQRTNKWDRNEWVDGYHQGGGLEWQITITRNGCRGTCYPTCTCAEGLCHSQ